MASTAVTDFKDIKQEQLQEFLHDSIQAVSYTHLTLPTSDLV